MHLHVRKTERGLSSAVLHGFTLAQGKKLLVMDADLQHPPESVLSFLEALDEPSLPIDTISNEGTTKSIAEEMKPKFALGTRYAKGYEMDKDWPFYRRVISWGARLLSRPLTNAQDPMGGFFALRKDLVSVFHNILLFLACCVFTYVRCAVSSSHLNHSIHRASRLV